MTLETAFDSAVRSNELRLPRRLEIFIRIILASTLTEIPVACFFQILGR